MKSNTIGVALNSTRELFLTNHIESAALDAQMILEYVLGKDRAFLLSHPELAIDEKERLQIDSLAARRVSGEPIAYLTGEKEFYGYNFHVDKNVLIPRPETEYLVESATKFLNSRIKNSLKIKNSKLKIIDMGTGSGCIAVSIALELHKLHELNNCEIFATDINKEALEAARRNENEHQVNVNFLESDLFANSELPDKFDLILANLPYVPKVSAEDLGLRNWNEKATDFEPQSAIFAEDNGAAIIKEFLKQARSKLNDNGLIIIELDPRNAKKIELFAREQYQNHEIKLTKDYAGHDRYLEIK